MKVVDCVIVGGSYGGLSAALALGRSLRQTVVIDEGRPCNRFTPHSQNFLTHDGAKPSDIAKLGKQQIQETYSKTVEFVNDEVVSIITTKNQETIGGDEQVERLFTVTTKGSRCPTFQAKSIIFATGIKDIFPEIPGFAECWGTSVIHCPYCHGYEFHSQPTGLLMKGPPLMHMAPLIRNLTSNLKVFSNGEELEMSEGQLVLFKRNNIEVIETPIKELRHENGYLTNVLLDDDTLVPLQAMYAALPFEVNAKNIMMHDLGCEMDENGYLVVDHMQKTTADGVFGVGDATTMFRSVANAVRGGNVAGAIVNMELCNQEFSTRERR